jgi:SnoaL-like domain
MSATEEKLSKEELRVRREKILDAHVGAESVHDVEGTVATFAGRPRYEMVALGIVFDGEDEVAQYLRDKAERVGSIDVKTPGIYYSDDAVIVETSTLPADERREGFGEPVRGISVFLFEGDRLVCERSYFDPVDAARLALPGKA